MSLLPIVAVNATVRDFGDLAVRRRGRDLLESEFREPWFRPLIADMFATLYATAGGIGLAAPQVGVLLRLAVIALHDGSAPMVLVNPSYRAAGDETDLLDERCLSVPDFAAPIRRSRRIQVQYLDQHGSAHDDLTEDFPARVMQHEIDHLDGILCIDRVTDRSDIRAELGGYAGRQAQRALDELFEAR